MLVVNEVDDGCPRVTVVDVVSETGGIDEGYGASIKLKWLGRLYSVRTGLQATTNAKVGSANAVNELNCAVSNVGKAPRSRDVLTVVFPLPVAPMTLHHRHC